MCMHGVVWPLVLLASRTPFLRKMLVQEGGETCGADLDTTHSQELSPHILQPEADLPRDPFKRKINYCYCNELWGALLCSIIAVVAA